MSFSASFKHDAAISKTDKFLPPRRTIWRKIKDWIVFVLSLLFTIVSTPYVTISFSEFSLILLSNKYYIYFPNLFSEIVCKKKFIWTVGTSCFNPMCVLQYVYSFAILITNHSYINLWYVFLNIRLFSDPISRFG